MRGQWAADITGGGRQNGVSLLCIQITPYELTNSRLSKVNIVAMRLGPGKHLQGRSLMGGIVKPEEFDYFHEVTSFTNK
jgi:hypothetical protein